MKNITNTAPKSNQNQNPDHPDTRFSGRGRISDPKPPKPVRADQLQRRINIALSALGLLTPPLEPRGHEEIALYRICKGRGGPVELPAIQQDERGRGFISQLNPRIHSLRMRFGFDLQNKIDWSCSPVRSWYWIVLDEHGRPRMSAVEILPAKDGKPKNAEAIPRAENPSHSPQSYPEGTLFPMRLVEYVDPEKEARR